MQRKHIITISGTPGSGKSSTADRVAELLGYTRYSSGDMVRKILANEGMTLAQFNLKARDDHNLDDKIDEQLRQLRTQKDLVIDSRLGFYWIPESFKVYLKLDIEVATVRIFKDAVANTSRSSVGEQSNSLQSVSQLVKARMQNERNRFKDLYNVDPYNERHFDLIVDTSRHSPQTVALAIFDSYRKWLKTEVWKQQISAVPMGYSFKNQY